MNELTLPPLCTELPYLADSTIYFETIRDKEWAIFLDSTTSKHPDARYDIQTASPFITLTTVGKNTLITRDNNSELSDQDPFSALTSILESFPAKQNCDLPFCGGALGYFAYDLARRIEKLPALGIDAEHIPDMAIGIYDWAIITDHHQQRCWLASYALNPDTHIIWDELVTRITTKGAKIKTDFKVISDLKTNFNKDSYRRAFNKIQHYIREGDCYQVNLAQRFEVKAEGDPWVSYSLLRKQNAAPFSCYFSTPHVSILSSSPERLLKVQQKHIETKPIKGTRARDLADPEQDLLMAEELQNSIKDRAENLMIVDLLRNDIGKVCIPGSIKVAKPFALESFATVHHLVSTITGTLKDEQSPTSLLRACFPGGSITGAPKLRAMEIIEELEPNRRGIYCGSIAYIGFDGKMDSNITIRTLIYNNNLLRFWAGGGIVSDSSVDEEYKELLDKSAAMLKLIEQLQCR